MRGFAVEQDREVKSTRLCTCKEGHYRYFPLSLDVVKIVDIQLPDLEVAIKELEESRSDAGKLAELKAELEKINRKKAEYVEEHPEQRRLVYRRRKEGEPEPELPILKKRNLFKKNGLPRHPERSIYYDPTMNPFGVAPPGMPYVERREDILLESRFLLTPFDVSVIARRD